MGSAALTRFKDSVAPAFIAGTPVCASGYYHGIVERAFLGQPTHKLDVVARQLCSDPQIAGQRFLAYQCIHGLGHGLMIYTGYDLPGSLKTCDGLRSGFDRVSCSGGVFMENFNSSYGVTSRYLRKNDPIYPCNDVAGAPQALLLPARHGQHPALDQLRPEEDGRRLPAQRAGWVDTCYESFGRDVSGIAGKDERKALASCRLAKSYQGDCLYGVSREIVNADAMPPRGGRFCSQAPVRYRARCYSGVGSVLASLESDPGEPASRLSQGQRSLCRRLSARRRPDRVDAVAGSAWPAAISSQRRASPTRTARSRCAQTRRHRSAAAVSHDSCSATLLGVS